MAKVEVLPTRSRFSSFPKRLECLRSMSEDRERESRLGLKCPISSDELTVSLLSSGFTNRKLRSASALSKSHPEELCFPIGNRTACGLRLILTLTPTTESLLCL